jgi:hypothetical protein
VAGINNSKGATELMDILDHQVNKCKKYGKIWKVLTEQRACVWDTPLQDLTSKLEATAT